MFWKPLPMVTVRHRCSLVWAVPAGAPVSSKASWHAMAGSRSRLIPPSFLTCRWNSALPLRWPCWASIRSCLAATSVAPEIVVETLLAFDFGLKRIGVAIGNTLIKQAQPLTIISAATNDAKFTELGKLIEQWQPARCIVGLPSHPDGAEHEMTVRCRRFANQLHGRFGVATVLVDERYSSAVIPQRRGEHIDAEAAAIILQQYFDDTHEHN